MSGGTFADYLARLDRPTLTALLEARPDVRVEPVPRGFGQLAQRLEGVESVSAALHCLHHDALVASQAIVALGSSATVPSVAAMLDASVELANAAVERLRELGLLWENAGQLCLTPLVHAHWSMELGIQQPFAKIAKLALVEDLRAMATGLGITPDGLRKGELIAALDAELADVRRLAGVVAALPQPARRHLEQVRHAYFAGYVHYGSPGQGSSADPAERLVRAGLLLRVHNRPTLPREVAVAAWLAGEELSLTGPPVLALPKADQAKACGTAQAAAHEALRGVTALLDEAGVRPIVALKRGGVGQRERARLAAELSVPGELLALWIDLACAAGLLGHADPGYVPTTAYSDWRAAGAGERWVTLAKAWFALEHAPTSREEEGTKDVPPPLPVESRAGLMRRALLAAARTGVSVRGVGGEIDWFSPLHGYRPPRREAKVEAVVREAESLGVIADDVLSELGEHLLATTALPPGDRMPVPPSLLPEERCTVVLQSDLTAVVSGQPSTAVSRLLTASAVRETGGTAAVWRFTRDSVRTALDAGWTASELVGELAAVSNHGLPQPLEYLVNDVARRHGQVRVRRVSCCVVADETTITEILHTRSLRALKLNCLAPTVLSSPRKPDEVLTALRAAGLSPVAEDAQGTVIVEPRTNHQVETPERTPKVRGQLSADELAERLFADPTGAQSRPEADDPTLAHLTRLNSQLSDAELELLADAVTNHHDILIAYRDKKGSRTTREIQPGEIYGKWLGAWCYLRDDEREFTIANIESVAPVG